MNFKINKIKIENFRAIPSLEVDLGEVTKVVGDNESNKSTFASAISWCLNGKNIENQSTFEIVPYGKYGKVSPKVELECMIDDDKPVTLTRVYVAKMTRDKQFSKYDTVCLVNGLDVGVKKFQEYISKNICNDEVFKILSIPKTFAEDCPKKDKELLWQSQRRLLMSILDSSQSDLDIASCNNKYSLLIEPLKRYDTINNYLSFLKKELSITEKDISSFESKLEQQEKNLVDSKYESIEEIDSLIESVESKIEELNRKNEEFKANSQSSKKKELMEQYNTLKDKEKELLNEYNNLMFEFNNHRQEKTNQLCSLKIELDGLIKKQVDYANAIEKLKTTKIRTTCETCKQPLTKEMIEHAVQTVRQRIANGKKAMVELKEKQLKVKQKYDELNIDIDHMQEPVKNPKIFEIQEQMESIMKASFEIPTETNIEGYEEEFLKLRGELYNLSKAKMIVEQNVACEKMIEQLEEDNKLSLDRYSKLQRAIDLSKDFISYKCVFAEEKINSLFKNVRFELFEKNKSNDDIKETCVLKFNNIKYSDLSLSTKLVANLEVVKAFQKYYNIKVPIIVDNMESVTDPLDIDCQIIKMYVKEELCPVCGGKSDRKNTETGDWQCLSCGNKWKKHLIIENEKGE